MKSEQLMSERTLDQFQRAAFDYFLQAVNPANGLIADTSRENSPASIGVVGFALSSYPVAVERGWMSRADAVERTLATLRFLRDSDQSGSPEATGFKGFYYHFLDMQTGVRAWRSELSTIDTALLIAGALTAGRYFSANTLTNENVFDLNELPRRLLVIGGGPFGCELAQAFSRFGSQTIIAQSWPLFLPKEERDAAQLISNAFARDGIEVRLNTRAVNVRAEGGQKLVDLVSDDYKSTVAVDVIQTGTGRVPNVEGLDLKAAEVDFDCSTGVKVNDFLQTSNPQIYAAGDSCLEHKYTHTADASARIVVQNTLFDGRQRLSALIIPWCTYTDPAIAHVGLYVRQAREQDVPVKTFTIPMHDAYRAICDSEEEGFVKIHVREGTDQILGATIVARHAGDMIHEITLAMVAGIGLSTLGSVIYASPTQGEAIKKAADAYNLTRLGANADGGRRRSNS